MSLLGKLFRERPDYGLIFAADDHLKRAIELKRFDRECGIKTEEWAAFMAALTNLPAELSQNDRARAILALEIP